jgi:hypothetical protein
MTSAESGLQRGRHSVNPILKPRNDCNLQSVDPLTSVRGEHNSMPQRKCWFRMRRILGVFTTALVLSVATLSASTYKVPYKFSG